ncbi:MAG TPA: signal peptidase I [Anaerolineaceae bacterium]|nr:signal peptidase I [Longilinea sp.]NMD30513.1 signal peptidase I [Chloroflexota bacterium]HNS62934.1 signal peptidase I [Anaerolineaceae bacterium]HNZ00426.1 signal peptidase I [Anaerolineaceae bacterium]HOD43920.1 signal peptidase I [Anaerolineaceae bacterium]
MEQYRSVELEEKPVEEPKSRGFKSLFLEIIQTLLLAVVLYFVIDAFIGRVRVENISMLPTLKPGEFLLVNKLAYKLGDFDHGDIVIFHYPLNPNEDYIKRVMGIPGDEITVEDGVVSVNGYPLTEDYISAPPNYQGTWTVPEGSIFVLGDNRNQSSDSHTWGMVPVENVVGRALVIYWPLSEAKILRHPNIVNAASTQ